MENNFKLTGDEARMLMVALVNSTANLPAGPVLMLYMRLAEISSVQPPAQKREEPF